MEFTFTADQMAFRDSVSRFLMTEAPPEMLRSGSGWSFHS